MIDRLKKHGDLLIDEPLAKHTTFKIGGKAAYFIYPKNELGLIRIIELCKSEKMPFKIIGKGSNILANDGPYKGLIICLDRYFTDFNFEDDGLCYVQSGVSIILLAMEAMKRSLSGLEFASGIPATIGGAAYMNAGAYKSDMASIIRRVYILRNDSPEWLSNKECHFAYRTSIFQKHPDWIILGMELKLEKGNQKEIKDLMDARRQRRLDSQPLDKPSAGSMFRNPSDAPAWKLIEECGLRGKQIGGAMVSKKHANFIVNNDSATASDVEALVNLIKKRVFDKYGITLKTEVERFNWRD